MFEKYSSSAVKVIMLSQQEAVRLGHDHVGAAEIFVGLMAEQSGMAFAVLESLGVTLPVARNGVERIVGFGQSSPRIDMPFTSSAKHVLEQAWTAANELHSKDVDTEHLLLGLLQVPDEHMSAILSGMGLDASQIEHRLRDEISANLEDLYAIRLEPFPHSDNFTQSAMRAMKRAKAEERLMQVAAIGSEQILLGLLGDKATVACKLLNESGLSLAFVRTRLKIREQEKKAQANFTVGMVAKSDYSDNTKVVLENAWHEAQARFSNYVSAEDLLIALLRQNDDEFQTLMTDLSVDKQRLVSLLEDALSKISSEQAVLKRAEPTLTEDVLATLVFANEEARKGNSKRTGVEHILCGLILQNGLAMKALDDFGVDYTKALNVVQQMNQTQVAEPARKPVLSKLLDAILVLFRQRPFTAEAESLMSQALKETQTREDLFVDSGHVLLALISVCSQPNNVLARLGVDKQGLREKIISLMDETA